MAEVKSEAIPSGAAAGTGGDSLAGSLLGGSLPAGRWRAWLDRRVPPRRVIRLHQGNVFIFPPQTGLGFLLLVILLILAAINYQNSLVFGLAFLLASLFAVTIGHTFRNLGGLEIEAAGVEPVFAGEHALFRIRIARRGNRHYHAVRVGWPGEAVQSLDLDEETELRVRVPVAADHRGWLDPGRMRVETTWPLGLLRAWTWIDLRQRVLVYPRPIAGGVAASSDQATGDGDVVVRGGSEDFLGLREYRAGDPLKHVAWKSYAREGEMMLKEFGAYADRRLWLDWDAMPGVDTETRLSMLCHQALELDRHGEEFGLRLPGGTLEPGQGPVHRSAVLRALALHGIADVPPVAPEAGGDAVAPNGAPVEAGEPSP
ncbi:MAG TPA: DUF58 domain-containing protein [Pseudomonadales bacterium]|nr:DUF58 domain-containing protein [Pseudomonadales bacterium]